MFEQYVTEQTVVERLVVVGPHGQEDAVRQALYAAGYHLTSSGPYTDREMFPDCDPTRFLFLCERTQGRTDP